MKRLEYVPKYEELNDYYGNPEKSPGILSNIWMEQNLERIIVPFKLRLSWDAKIEIDAFPIHRKIATVVVDIFEEILQYRDENYLYDNGYNYFGGSFNYRPIRGGNRLSTHSWGISIDMNPQLAPYRKKDKNGRWINNQPQFITDAFLKRGFVTFPWDGMHFQACLSESKYAIYDKDVIQEINGFKEKT